MTLLIARDSVLESVSEPLLLVQISVNNNCLLAKAMAATRWFNSSDWYKKFNVEFKGEEGMFMRA